jgi:hypothetical protein
MHESWLQRIFSEIVHPGVREDGRSAATSGTKPCVRRSTQCVAPLMAISVFFLLAVHVHAHPVGEDVAAELTRESATTSEAAEREAEARLPWTTFVEQRRQLQDNLQATAEAGGRPWPPLSTAHRPGGFRWRWFLERNGLPILPDWNWAWRIMDDDEWTLLRDHTGVAQTRQHWRNGDWPTTASESASEAVPLIGSRLSRDAADTHAGVAAAAAARGRALTPMEQYHANRVGHQGIQHHTTQGAADAAQVRASNARTSAWTHDFNLHRLTGCHDDDATCPFHNGNPPEECTCSSSVDSLRSGTPNYQLIDVARRRVISMYHSVSSTTIMRDHHRRSEECPTSRICR